MAVHGISDVIRSVCGDRIELQPDPGHSSAVDEMRQSGRRAAGGSSARGIFIALRRGRV
jgi:hypothetical protein